MCTGCIQTTTQATGSFISGGGPLMIATGLLIGARIAWGYNIARIKSSRVLQVVILLLVIAFIAYLSVFIFF